MSWSYNPGPAETAPVWAVPISLAATLGITLVFSSSAYLDVSVQRVCPPCGVTGLQPAGLPHSDTHGSMLVCSSPWIFAAYRVLHRLWKPRHPPYALLLLFAPVAAATDVLIILYLNSIPLRVSSLTSNMQRPMAPTRFHPNMSMKLWPHALFEKKDAEKE